MSLKKCAAILACLGIVLVPGSTQLGDLYPEIVEVFENETANFYFISETLFSSQSRITCRPVSAEGRILCIPNQAASCFLLDCNRTKLVCNESACSLQILTVKRNETEQKWECRETTATQTESFGTIIVNVPVTTVNVTSDQRNIVVRANSTVTVKCLSSPSRPNVTISLQMSAESTLPVNEENTVFTERNYGLWQAETEFKFSADKEYNGKRIFCFASNYPNKNATSDIITLDVQYPPSFPPRIENLNTLNYNIKENTADNLTCYVDESNPPANLSWSCQHTKEAVLSGNQTYQNLQFKATRDTDATCTCMWLFNNTEKSFSTVKFNVLYKPDVIWTTLYYSNTNYSDIIPQIKVIEDKKLTLYCSANGNPLPHRYQWTGLHLSNSSKLEFLPSRFHEGNISCEAFNTMVETKNRTSTGSFSRNYTILVLYPPNLQVDVQNNQTAVLEGDNVSVTCKAESGLTSNQSVRWNTTQSSPGNVSSTLRIPNVSRKDSVDYECRLEYSLHSSYGSPALGNNKSIVNLDVMYAPEHVSTFIRLNNRTERLILKSVLVLENTLNWLTCTADGNPKPHFAWLGKFSRDSEVLIFNATRTDSGIITCKAASSMRLSNKTTVNRTQEQSYNLKVLYPPDLKTHRTEEAVLEGDTFIYDCEIDGGSTTDQKINWTRYGSAGNNKSVLSITNVSRNMQTIYTCILNYTLAPTYEAITYGSKERQLTLRVLYQPEKIEASLTLNGTTNDTIASSFSVVENAFLTVHCSASGNPKPSHYNWTGPGSNNNSSTITWTASRNNEANFICNAYNWMNLTNGTLLLGHRNSTYNIGVLYAPQLKEYSEENVTIGTNFYVDCIKKPGNPDNVTVCWTGQNSTCNRTLKILNATLNDSGLYNCTGDFHFQPTYGQAISLSLGTSVFIHVNAESNARPVAGAKAGNPFVGAAVGGALAGVVVVIATIVTLYVVKKRRRLSQKDNDAKSHAYENFSFTPDRKEDKCLPAPPPPEKPEVEEDGTANNIAETEFYNSEDENPYANDPKVMDVMRICATELFSYVSNKSKEHFFEEFEKFPKGLVSTIKCTVARRPEYIHLNRYQGIYPYDHSRVQLLEVPDFFINANYIDGYARSRQYIASLGPTERHTLGFTAFWNMVWYEKSDVIVMLTNLSEPSGMKCEQYWPDFGKSMEIDNFLIQSETEEVTAEYTVRIFTVSKGVEARLVNQLHYTAWPDKTVPESVTSLIEFRQRVKAAPTRSLGPLVVHCSAGVGRTGTYIALDRLIEEGKSTDYVNVFDCVMSMRKQRVNMVQTPEQYVYLHQTLVYCLAFDIEPVTAENIGEYIQTTSNNVFSQLYQQLKQTVEKVSEEYIDAQNKHASFTDWNRRRADIPGDRHRVLLSLDKEFGQSNYINAVYLASFLRLDHFIIAQSPLPKTVEDFVGMLYKEKSACIVALDDYQQKGTNNATYLPAENEQFTYGFFSISCLSVKAKPAYVIRKVKLSHDGKQEQGEKVAYHFEFTAWKHDEKLPKDPKVFVEFVREIEDFAKESKEEDPHVIVHCMSGSDRSGLFCAVSNLIQKMELEQQVSVVNMLRRVRERRRTAISSLEQLKFCFHAMNAFVRKTQHLSTRKKSSLTPYENSV